MVGPKKQDFWPQISIFKGNHCMYFENTGSASSSILGMILQNKVVQRLKLEKNVLKDKWSPKLIFLNGFFV